MSFEYDLQGNYSKIDVSFSDDILGSILLIMDQDLVKETGMKKNSQNTNGILFLTELLGSWTLSIVRILNN
jgi:hypothetical protein